MNCKKKIRNTNRRYGEHDIDKRGRWDHSPLMETIEKNYFFFILLEIKKWPLKYRSRKKRGIILNFMKIIIYKQMKKPIKFGRDDILVNFSSNIQK